ncbi:hypothetical protein HYU11_05350 [Candidatus Woesearchaeota archaeon]|nr:hypothetical protein [Candidatus Woesearchaeota archaeon]
MADDEEEGVLKRARARLGTYGKDAFSAMKKGAELSAAGAVTGIKGSGAVAAKSLSAIKKGAEISAAGAASGARGTGSVAVKGLDFLKPRMQSPFIFFLLIITYQLFEILTNYEIPLAMRLFIYIVFFVFAWLAIKIDVQQAGFFFILSFITPYAWQYIPKTGGISEYAGPIMFIPALSLSLWLGISSSYEGLAELIRISLVIFLIFIIAWPNVQAILKSTGFSEYVPNVDPKMGWKGIQNGIDKTTKTFSQIPEAINKAFQSQIIVATGDYYTGRVDENSKRPVGVYIEKLEAADPEYYEGQKVVVLADIKAQTLNSEIKLSPNCWSDRKRREEVDGMVIPPKLTIETYGIQSFDCKFAANSLKSGTHTMTAAATFSFETMAYLKTYLMDKDKIRSLRSIEKDPLEFYKIQETKPVAVYTNGPVSIGMEVKSALPIALKLGEVDPFSLGITIGNNWQGKIESISELKISLPQGMEIDTSSCSHIFNSEGLKDNYNVYSLDVAAERLVNPRAFTNIKNHQSLRCYIDVKDESISSLLGKTPVSVRFFRAEAKYDYTVEKSIPLEIKSEERTSVEKGTCGSKLADMARRGLGRPGAETGSWSAEKEPESDEPTSPGGYIGWAFSRYAHVYKDSEMGLTDSINEQAASGKLVDGEINSKTTPNLDSLKNGDIVFFCGKYDYLTGQLAECENEEAGHAAIYTGNGRIIHAATKVKEESMRQYESNYIGARRMCKEEQKNDKPDPVDVKSTVIAFADEYEIPRDVALGVADVEGGLQHYAANTYTPVGWCDGKVKCGDLDSCRTGSIGMMQINSCAHPTCFSDEGVIYDPKSGDMCKGAHACSGTDARNIRCNIEASMRLLRSGYDQGQRNPYPGCHCGGKYTGWDYAIKSYNGCVCDKNPNYVSEVRRRGKALTE